MGGLVPRIHVLVSRGKDVDGRGIGKRSDAVLRTAMPGHDERTAHGQIAAPRVAEGF
jgi:hypothetical protein